MLLLGSMPVLQGRTTANRIVALLWGVSGCGKSTFAATAPGKKLWLSFGDQEHAVVQHRKDVFYTPLYEWTTDELFQNGKSENPFGLDKFLSANPEFRTVVLDSITALSQQALRHAVKLGVGSGKHFRPTSEEPGLAAFGGRNAIVYDVVNGLLRVTAKHGVNIIITGHEADPVKEQVNGAEIIHHITLELGGKMVNNIACKLSEVWYMTDDGNQRRIAIRNTRKRRPMKTRMFSGCIGQEFVLDYDANKPDEGQMTIASWHKKWNETGEKILPNGKADHKGGS